MKLILSRKGFDASNGGVASPILPSGRLCSLPIPEETSPIRYGQIAAGSTTMGSLVSDLTAGAITPDDAAHLDPDLACGALTRCPGWRPLFGQAGAAQGHLRNQAVGRGDLFLFYGWFRRVERRSGRYRYVPGAPNLHVLFGWLQVERVLSVATGDVPAWARYHPHVCRADDRTHNTLYVAREHLTLPGHDVELPGAGVFPRYRDSLRLTAPNASRSIWRLPAWFHPGNRPTELSYHRSLDRWRKDGTHVRLETVPRGQEFVLDCEAYPEAIDWAVALIARATAHRTAQ